jgi:Copper transport outer membrane protein, MctB
VFDFRYHALSLVAVFLALAVGLLLGVAIGDSGLVSSAKQDIEQSLRGDVRASRAQADELRGELDHHETYEKQTFPDLVGGRLAGEHIGLLFLGDTDESSVDEVRDAVETAGADLRWVGALSEPPDVSGLAERAQGTRYAAMSIDPSLLSPFAQRIGDQLVSGGRLAGQARPSLMASFSGQLGAVDGVVVMRSPSRPDESDDQKGTTATLEDGVVAGLSRSDVPVVGVEEVDTDPSQVSWYRDRKLASVDSIDEVSGRAALVFALAGADGAYGVKSTAEALLPRVVGAIASP